MALSIKSLSEDDRPREKMLAKGVEALSDAELLAILLGSGHKEMNAVELAQHLLVEAGQSLDSLGKQTIQDLCKVKGIGPAKAVTIVAALEMGKRRKSTGKNELLVTCSQDIYDYVHRYFHDLPNEKFHVLMLNRRNGLIKDLRISVGGTSSTVVDVKLLYKQVLSESVFGAPSGIVLAHNHPSGNPKPSSHDIELTKKVYEAGQLLDIRLLDHIIYAQDKYYSFADHGQL